MASPNRSWSFPMLPPEIILEILYRTPASSLVRSKPTCKIWYALITDRRFIYQHLRHSRKRFIRTAYDTVQILDPVNRTRSETPLPNVFNERHNIRMMVHCDGLLLCMRGNAHHRNTSLIMWNPALKKLKWIKPSRCFTTSDYYGIGYDRKKSRCDYKILRFTDHRLDRGFPHDPYDEDEDEDEAEVELYECKTRSWKTLNAKVDWDVDCTCKGVSVMGNMYWYVQKYCVAKKKYENYILGFDFSVETFKEICFCPRPRQDNYLACFDGDRLSLLKQDQETTSPIEVWVSSKLGDGDGDVLFSKYFSVSRPDLPALLFHTDLAHPVYCIGQHKRIMAWCQREVEEGGTPPICLTFYEIDESGVRIQLVTERNNGYDDGAFLCGYVYVPSLVPLPV